MAETENKTLQKDKKRRVKALFSYTPVNIDELQLKVNDILEVIEETEEGWWKGVLNGAVGMFPSNFVIELDNSEMCNNKSNNNEITPTKSLSKIKNSDILETNLKKDLTHPPATKHDVKSASDDAADSPKITDSVDRKGSLGKKNVDPTAPRLPPKPVREQARAIYPYTALNEDELTLKEGDIITVISKEVEDKGWWKGELNNKTGVFPDNFVQLIKVAEEQKKPERPEKPSSALVSRASLKSTDKNVPDFSPKIDKKAGKTPPVKPPPPEIHKKEHDKVTPPFPVKKPQIPYPMKKPSRSSLGSKFSGFSPPSTLSSSKPPDTPPPIPPAPATPPVTTASESKQEVTKSAEKCKDKEEKEKDVKKENKDSSFETLESSGKKLVHLTANRAKAPNRRPPSHIFLKENEKENGVTVDPRRLSEPLLSEMKLMHQVGEVDSHKANASTTNETKAKIPPSRPLPPSVRGNKPAIQGSLILTKTISSEECIVKAPEPIKKAILPDVSSISGPEILPTKRTGVPLSDFKPVSVDKEAILQPKKTDVSSSDFKPVFSDKEVVLQPKKTDVSSSDFKPVFSDKEVVLQPKKTDVSSSDFKPVFSDKEVALQPKKTDVSLSDFKPVYSDKEVVLQPKKTDLPSSDFKPVSSDKEILELKQTIESLKITSVTRSEFNELEKQVKELKESLEQCISINKKAINELKTELESEKKKRQALELELQNMRESQST